MKISRTELFWGVLLIVTGIGFGGEALGLWSFELFFKGWWTLFIIVPCLVNMVETGLRRSNLIGFSIGTLFLLSGWNVISESLVIPLLLVIIGIVVIFVHPYQSRDD